MLVMRGIGIVSDEGARNEITLFPHAAAKHASCSLKRRIHYRN